MLKISDYEFLCTLHDCMNITQAARKLFISQPALTKRLQQIEQDMDTVIVYRNIKGVQFTPEGEYIVSYAQKCIDDYKDVKRVLQGFHNDRQNTVYIVGANTMCYYVLPGLLAAFRREYPGISLALENAVSGECGRMVYNAQADVGFVCGEQPWAFRQDLICPEYMSLISKSKVNLKELPYLSRIDPRMSAGSRIAISNWWQRHFDVPPYIGMNVLTIENCIKMIHSGLGYGLLFHSSLINDGQLQQTHLQDSNGQYLSRNNYMIYRDDSELNPGVRKFIDFCHDYFKVIFPQDAHNEP